MPTLKTSFHRDASLRMLVGLCLVMSACNRTSNSTSNVKPADKPAEKLEQPVAAAPAAPTPPEPKAMDEFELSHERMLKTLQEVDRQSQETHPFLGKRPLKIAEQAIRNSNDKIPAWDRSVMHGMYGQELLRAGRTKEAVEQMKISVELMESVAKTVPKDVQQQVYYLVGVANLRDAETVNCVHCINGERCLFPISGEGVHEDKTSSRNAIQYFTKALEMNPDDRKARWLLNVTYMTLGEHPEKVPPQYVIEPSTFKGEPSPVGAFSNIAGDKKINVKGCAGGVIVDDFDGDQDLDVIFSTWETNVSLVYFTNNSDGTFTNKTKAANLEGINGGLNLVQADYDNDGDLDVLVLRGAWLESFGRHPKSLLRNDGHGRFLDVTYAVGLGEDNYPTQSASWADFDRDGDLDLYVGNEAYPCQLFENKGGKFTEITKQAGVVNGGPTKAVSFGDYDQDGWPDIYVSNLGGANLMYHNQRDGTFVNVAKELGVEGPFFSFPIWFWDANNDGLLDLYVSSYKPGLEHVSGDYLGLPETTEPDAFYFGTADGKFEDRREQYGFTRVTQPMGCNTGDIDNDGFLDFYIGTGFVDYEGLIPNLLFHNDAGQKFSDITFSANVGHLQKGHAVSLADFDNDGDLDVFAVMGGWFSGDAFARALFANPGNKHNWLDVQLRGQQSNRYGIGARMHVTLTKSNGETQHIYRWMDSGGSFGANPLRAHFGLSDCERIDSLEVHWPTTGKTQKFSGIQANQLIQIDEGIETAKQLVVGSQLKL